MQLEGSRMNALRQVNDANDDVSFVFLFFFLLIVHHAFFSFLTFFLQLAYAFLLCFAGQGWLRGTGLFVGLVTR
jgi:hypothetical protein